MHTTEIVLSFPRPSNQRTIQRAQSIHLNNSFAKTL